MNPKIIKLNSINSLNGDLIVASAHSEIPFIPKRVFLIHNVFDNELVRGKHAHKECHQFLIVSSGSLTIRYLNKNINKTIVLDNPNVGLYLPPLTWSEQTNYNPDTILLVLASHDYNELDYIRNYEDFINYE
jgi:hypothetical protein